jgi:hypothetical protein
MHGDDATWYAIPDDRPSPPNTCFCTKCRCRSVSAQTSAKTIEEKSFAIAARSDRSDRGFTDSRVKMKMVLRNAAGRVATRTLVLKTLEDPDEQVGNKSIIVFDSPADIDGTALLSQAKILHANNQSFYLPALKWVKRISSVNKSGPFVGSKFAFEDFAALELNNYSYRYIRSESCGELTCDVVERKPRYEHSGYSRQLAPDRPEGLPSPQGRII